MLNLLLVASVTQAFKHHRNGTDGTECIQGGDDYIIGKLCTEQCVGYLVECVAECNNDPVCISMCAREESKCVDSCPCHTDCMEGCFGCEHPLCNQVSQHFVRFCYRFWFSVRWWHWWKRRFPQMRRQSRYWTGSMPCQLWRKLILYHWLLNKLWKWF